MSPATVPAIEGWFSTDPAAPHLIGTRCGSCGTYYFPPETRWCRNPDCDGTALGAVALSRRGRVWSYTDNRYQPPPPYVSPDPFVPFGIAAVELAEEKMVVLGQLVPGTDLSAMTVGQEVELVLGTLYEDGDNRYLVWMWKVVDQ